MWQNQTLQNIFRRSQQRSFHLNSREHAFMIIFGEHATHAVIVCQHYLFSLQIIGTCILKVFHPPCVSDVESLIDFVQLILEILKRDIYPNLEKKWGFPQFKRTWGLNKLSIDSVLHHKKLNNQWKTHSNIPSNTWSANYT